MKRFSILLALLLLVGFGVRVNAEETTINYSKYYEQIIKSLPPQPENKKIEVYQPADKNNYIYKYNLNDVDIAPWANGGKRKL